MGEDDKTDQHDAYREFVSAAATVCAAMKNGGAALYVDGPDLKAVNDLQLAVIRLQGAYDAVVQKAVTDAIATVVAVESEKFRKENG